MSDILVYLKEYCTLKRVGFFISCAGAIIRLIVIIWLVVLLSSTTKSTPYVLVLFYASALSYIILSEFINCVAIIGLNRNYNYLCLAYIGVLALETFFIYSFLVASSFLLHETDLTYVLSYSIPLALIALAIYIFSGICLIKIIIQMEKNGNEEKAKK